MPALRLVAILLCVAPDAATHQFGDLPFYIAADRVRVNLPNSSVSLDGDAKLTNGELAIAADQIQAQLQSADDGWAAASGRVKLQGPGGATAQAARLEFDFGTRTGHLREARVQIPITRPPPYDALLRPEERPRAALFSFSEGTISPRGFDAYGVSLTTSPADPPQFQLLARRALVELGADADLKSLKRINARGARLQVYNYTFLGIDNIDFGRGGIFLPILGYNSTEGFFIEKSFSVGTIEPIRTRFTVRLGTANPLSGRMRVKLPTSLGTFDAIGSQKERMLLPIDPAPSLYSRIPEFGYSTPEWSLPGLGGNGNLRLTYGLYDEEGSETAWRSAARVDWGRPIHRGTTSAVTVGGGGYYAWYDGRREYGYLRGELSADKAFGYRFYLGGNISSYLLTGATPFRFDNIEIATQLNLRMKWRVTPHWVLKHDYVIDVDRRAFRGATFGVLFRDRLLEYGLALQTRPDWEVKVDAQILGF